MPLPHPFIIATQTPSNLKRPLPRAQLDHFLLRMQSAPASADDGAMLYRFRGATAEVPDRADSNSVPGARANGGGRSIYKPIADSAGHRPRDPRASRLSVRLTHAPALSLFRVPHLAARRHLTSSRLLRLPERWKLSWHNPCSPIAWLVTGPSVCTAPGQASAE